MTYQQQQAMQNMSQQEQLDFIRQVTQTETQVAQTNAANNERTAWIVGGVVLAGVLYWVTR